MTEIMKFIEVSFENIPSLTFDESMRTYSDVPGQNRILVKNTEDWANGALKLRGHLFLNEIYDILGAPRTRTGQIKGWLKDEGRVIFDVIGSPHTNALSISFNVQGFILDKI